MSYDTILFDLDGTLTDSQEGIWNSFQYALSAFPAALPDRRLVMGPPLSYSFGQLCGLGEKEVEEAIIRYREYFGAKGLFENEVYDGVPEMLEGLKAMDKQLLVATSKPAVYAEQILEHFNLRQYFMFVAGSELDNTRTEKAEVIAYAMERAGLTSQKGILMVGDRFHDVKGAKAMGIPCAGVLYGYGTEQELSEAGADFLLETPLAVLDMLSKS